jgi:NAD(P)H-hydrate repair Nnr-like enzyme with NAD(P)H-hydrate dehydratase domain
VVPLDESAQGHVIGAGVRAAGEDIRNADSLVVGPGLDDPDETAELLRQLPGLVSSRAIVVLDGFALGVLPRVSEIAEAFSGRLILTPNQAEAARLLGHAVDEPSRVAPSIAEAYGAVVSCANTIADPIGGLWSAGSGTTGLGTSGSGDVLCGAITGLAARGAEPNQAAVWGTYLHTTAGDARTTASGAIGFLAHELLPELPIILERLRPQ